MVNASKTVIKTLFAANCVCCGTENNLSLHHVVPAFIEAFLPFDEFISTWHVPLCCECHDEVEINLYKPFYDEEILFPFQRELNSIHWVRQLAFDISFVSSFKNEPIRRRTLLKNLAKSSFRSLQEAMNVNLDEISKIMAETSWEIKAEHIKRFIENNGGASGIRSLFKSLFFKMNPKCVPIGSMKTKDEESFAILEEVLA